MDNYERITEAIVRKLEQGKIPWHCPWEMFQNQNLISKKKYRGINTMLLACSNHADSPYWLTYKQATELGGHVKRGEHGSIVSFWGTFSRKDSDKEEGEISSREREHRFLKTYTVFNLAQCEEIPAEKVPVLTEKPHNPIAKAEEILSRYSKAPTVTHGGGAACYRPADDSIHMPPKKGFDSSEDYYSTLFHEMTHSTGHVSRLARKGILGHAHFGSHTYSGEELVAEMGAAFLAAESGIEAKTLDNSAAYIQSWLSRLKDDKKLVVVAAGQAQKAADMIMGL